MFLESPNCKMIFNAFNSILETFNKSKKFAYLWYSLLSYDCNMRKIWILKLIRWAWIEKGWKMPQQFFNIMVALMLFQTNKALLVFNLKNILNLVICNIKSELKTVKAILFFNSNFKLLLQYMSKGTWTIEVEKLTSRWKWELYIIVMLCRRLEYSSSNHKQ